MQVSEMSTQFKHEVEKDYLSGMPQRQITAKHFISVGTLYTILDSLGVETQKRNRKSKGRLLTSITEQEAEEITDQHMIMPLTTICEKYNITKHTFYTLLGRRQSEPVLCE